MITMQQSSLENQTAIIDMISSHKPLADILKIVLSDLEYIFKANKVNCSVMLYEPQTNTLAHTYSNTLSKSFIDAIEPVDVSPYGGSSGTAAFYMQPVVVEDIELNPICTKYRYIACMYGIRSSWAYPIMTTDQQLLGTLEFYSEHVGRPSAAQLSIIETYSRLAALAIANEKLK